MSTVNPNTRPTTETDESPMEFPRTPTEPARTDPHGGGGASGTTSPSNPSTRPQPNRTGAPESGRTDDANRGSGEASKPGAKTPGEAGSAAPKQGTGESSGCSTDCSTPSGTTPAKTSGGRS